MLAASWRMRPSPPEQGRPPLARTAVAASQSMAAMRLPPLVPWSMNRLVKSSRWRNVPLAMRSSVPASSGSRPAAQARRAAARWSVSTGAFGGEGGGGDVAVGGDAQFDPVPPGLPRPAACAVAHR